MPAIIVDPLRKTSTVNHTGRLRITRDQYISDVSWEGTHPTASELQVEADWGANYPSDSRVVVEFMQRSGYIKLEMGTVGNIDMVGSGKLEEFETTKPLHSRVLVLDTDTGLILGSSAKNLVPRPVEESETINILAFKSEKGDKTRINRIEFPEQIVNPVVVWINDSCTELVDALQSETKNPAIYALTVTPYLQTIAWRMVSNIRLNPDLDLDPRQTWEGRWDTWISSAKGLGLKGLEDIDYDDEDKAQQWIDSIVLAWSKKQGNPVSDVCSLLGGI